MANPKLSLAISHYDRHVPFFDGTVKAEGIDLNVLIIGQSDRQRDGEDRHERVPALVVHLEGLTIVAPALAGVAGNIDIGEKVHLDADRSGSLALFAPASPDVEGEAAGLVSFCPRVGKLGEECPDRTEKSDVRCRVGPRGPSDRSLVDIDDLIDLRRAAKRAVLAFGKPCPGYLVGQRREEQV